MNTTQTNTSQPVKNILDPSIRYIPSHSTDVRKTFERIRREREIAPRETSHVPQS